ncbi:unnamed protein product [Symbiodinium natans]|uniref:Uncharacterized protein n=1 Tax=Symbiodinium natans TaxID=878477 RepID=A0A812NML8_9DINO|nr:unnamed protein product [Symbiodinium natans]
MMLKQHEAMGKVTFSACVSACEKCRKWQYAVDLLSQMDRKRVAKNLITYGACISACAACGQWEQSLGLLHDMRSAEIFPDLVACNACITSFAPQAQWQLAVGLLQDMPGLRLNPDVISFSAAVGSCEESRQWQQALHLYEQMRRQSVRLDDFGHNALIGAYSRAGKWDLALQMLSLKRSSRYPVGVHACSASVSVCERAGRWQEVLQLWPTLQQVQEEANREDGELYELHSVGPEDITRHLERALELQWLVGYPFLAAGQDQLTHGFYKYIAGMQALCARELYRLVPESKTVMDMFCGSGTVLVEGCVAGKHVVGCDVSPLALFAAAHHADARHLDLEIFLKRSRALTHALRLKRQSWDFLRCQIACQEPGPVQDALHFVLLVALTRARDRTYLHTSSKEWGKDEANAGSSDGGPEDDLAPSLFHGMSQLFAARVRSLRAAMPRRSQVQIHRCDNRVLQLQEPVDSIITGPPYPGVYDYHAPASATADLLGAQVLYDFCAPGRSVGGGRAPTLEDHLDHLSSQYAPGREIGQNSQLREASDYASKWRAEQEAWLASACRNLRSGGTATLMIGDGDRFAVGDGKFDNLKPTVEAAEKVGFRLLATASIIGKSRHPTQPRGMKRTEHMVHLLKPG